MKEFLTIREIEFDSIDIQSHPTGMQQLVDLGAKTVPVVAKGNDWVFAQSLGDVADLLEIEFDAKPKLSPDELIDRMEIVMATASRLVRQFPNSLLDKNVRDRDRTYRTLFSHIFRIPEVFLDVTIVANEVVSYDGLKHPNPKQYATMDEIADYGESVRKRVENWRKDAKNLDFNKMVEVYWGKIPLHQVLERMTWHPAQHTRQLALLLQDDFNIRPDRPLGEKELNGLPVPERAWDD
jgi:hypothetical protein